jgi:hypothetical protein
MNVAIAGKLTTAVEVSNISPHGFWLLLGNEELFVPFASFPWFRSATIAQISKVEMPSIRHLYWPDLRSGPGYSNTGISGSPVLMERG